MKYLIVIERTDTGYSAYSPDVPGCVSTGKTAAAVRRNMRQALALHLEGMRSEGEPIPPPTSRSSYVEVAA
jgi:predicted RNase H-like HicB family nuclease